LGKSDPEILKINTGPYNSMTSSKYHRSIRKFWGSLLVTSLRRRSRSSPASVAVRDVSRLWQTLAGLNIRSAASPTPIETIVGNHLVDMQCVGVGYSWRDIPSRPSHARSPRLSRCPATQLQWLAAAFSSTLYGKAGSWHR